MKERLIIFAILIMSVSLFGQTYPELTIRDIQFVGDLISNNPADYQSPYEGDTVISIIFSDNSDSKIIGEQSNV